MLATARLAKTFVESLLDAESREYIWPWLVSQLPSRNPVSDGVPWITFGAVEWMRSHLRSGMSVFEYGSGGSTVFFSRLVDNVTSVEHDRQWRDTVREVLRSGGRTNVTLLLKEAESLRGDRAEDAAFTSRRKLHRGKSYRAYVTTVLDYPDSHFDLIFVDGRVRLSCLELATPKVRDGGYIILDDSERPEYSEAGTLMGSFDRFDFRGPHPYDQAMASTTVWKVEKAAGK